MQRLKGDPNLRLLRGFKKVPRKPVFSRYFPTLSATNIMNRTLEKMVMTAHNETVVYHVSGGSTAKEARETVKKTKAEKGAKKGRGRPKKDEKRVPAPVTDFPLNAIVTGANVHDSQLAIPMEKITEQRVQFCYSLTDAAVLMSAVICLAALRTLQYFLL